MLEDNYQFKFYKNPEQEEKDILLTPLVNEELSTDKKTEEELLDYKFKFYKNSESDVVEEDLKSEPTKSKFLFYQQPEDTDIKENIKQPKISLARELSYGAAQEMTVLGSSFQLAKAAFQAGFDKDRDYKEVRAANEEQRQEKIFEEFSEFKGREETAGVIAGRVGQALADPVTFLLPWAKIAKAGKIASLTAGGTFAAGDMAIREEALYGKINPNTVALGFGLGVVGAQLGDVVAAVYAKQANKTIDETVDLGKQAGGPKKVKIKGAQTNPKINPKNSKKAEEANAQTLIETEEFIENLGTLNVKINNINNRRKEISKEIKKGVEKNKKSFVGPLLKDDDYLPEFIKSSGFGVERIALTKELKKLNNEKNSLYANEATDNILDVLNTTLLNGHKKGILSEDITRGIVHEITRPLFGGLIGGAIGAASTGEGDTNDKMITFAIVGALAGGFQRRIQLSKYEAIPKKVIDDAGKEIVGEYKRGFFNYLKSVTAGSHVQDLMAWSAPVVNYASKMFKMQGGGVRLGQTTKQLSVEEEATLQLGAWRTRYSDLVGSYDDDVLILAGKIVNQRNLKSKKYFFLKETDEIKKIGKRKYNRAVKLSKDIDAYTSDFKKYARERGLDFKDETQYGLTQILDRASITTANYNTTKGILARAFYLQNSKEVGHRFYKPKGAAKIKEAQKSAEQTAEEYLSTSTNLRRNSIWAKEIDDPKFIFQGNTLSNKKEEFILNAARHFNKERTLYDQEARALASDLFVQNPTKTLDLLINNTINIAEFSKRFGSKGEGISKLFKDIDNNIAKMVDPTGKLTPKELFSKNNAAKELAMKEKKKIKDSLEAYFGVYHADKAFDSRGGKAFVTFLQTGLATTRLSRVAIPSLGDLLQTITNSGWKAGFKGAMSDIKLSREGLGLAGRQKQVGGKDATFVDKFVGNNRHDNIIQRELQDVMLLQGGNLQKYQQRSVDFTRKFFEVVQLGRVTRIARNWSFDTGVARALDISQLVKNKKTGFLKSKNALQKEMDTLGLTPSNFKYLSQFDSLKKAIADPRAKRYLKKAGMKSADRDALIPTVGNRRLFSQSKNPYVKFTGSFLSWAQAKTSQTNSLIARVENGDAALFLRMMAAVPLFASVREAQIYFSTSDKYKEEVAAETKTQKAGEAFLFSGLPTVWIEKVRNLEKFGADNFMESVAPVLGYIQDLSEIFSTPLIKMNDEEADKFIDVLGATGKEALEVVPIGKRAIDLIEKATEEEEVNLNFYSTGGLVKGKDDVPYTKEDAADRINKYTGKPYSDQMNRLGLADGGGDMTRVDGTQKSSQGWLGPIKNNVTGKDMTEVSMGIGPEDNQKLIPLLVPTLTKKEIEILKNMKIEGNIKNIPQSVKEKAIQHARKREEQGLNIFYNGE